MIRERGGERDVDGRGGEGEGTGRGGKGACACSSNISFKKPMQSRIVFEIINVNNDMTFNLRISVLWYGYNAIPNQLQSHIYIYLPMSKTVTNSQRKRTVNNRQIISYSLHHFPVP